MKTFGSFKMAAVVLSILVMLQQNGYSMAFEDGRLNSLVVKRSLCNTFGGCGSKRSIADQARGSFSRGESVGPQPATTSIILEADNINDLVNKPLDPALVDTLKFIVDYYTSGGKFREGVYLVVPKGSNGRLSASNTIELRSLQDQLDRLMGKASSRE